jgi:FMN reductase
MEMWQMPISNLKIVAIGGSLRERSFTYQALDYVASLLTGIGCHVRLLDLRVMQLPFCNGDNQDPRLDYPAVAELRQSVREAHALVLATPEYHGGVSGILKNALDLLDTEHLGRKVAGFISVLGGAADSNALNDLSRILRSCHAWVIPHHIAIGHPGKIFVDGRIPDISLRIRFEEFAQDLVRSAVRLCSPDRSAIETHGPPLSGSTSAVRQSAGA